MARRKKSRTEPFSIIPRRTIQSQELNSLSLHARWLYITLTSEWSRYEPKREVIFSYSRIRKITGLRYEKISSAIKELEKSGFIIVDHGRLTYTCNKFYLHETWLYLHDKDAPIVNPGDNGII